MHAVVLTHRHTTNGLRSHASADGNNNDECAASLVLGDSRRRTARSLYPAAGFLRCRAPLNCTMSRACMRAQHMCAHTSCNRLANCKTHHNRAARTVHVALSETDFIRLLAANTSGRLTAPRAISVWLAGLDKRKAYQIRARVISARVTWPCVRAEYPNVCVCAGFTAIRRRSVTFEYYKLYVEYRSSKWSFWPDAWNNITEILNSVRPKPISSEQFFFCFNFLAHICISIQSNQFTVWITKSLMCLFEIKSSICQCKRSEKPHRQKMFYGISFGECWFMCM